MPTTSPIHVTTDNFKAEVLEADTAVVIDFWAPWCGPCRQVGPALDELAPDFADRVKIAKVNIDEEPELAQAFRIRSIPTLVAMRDGAVVDQMVGWSGKAHLREALAKLAEMGGKNAG